MRHEKSGGFERCKGETHAPCGTFVMRRSADVPLIVLLAGVSPAFLIAISICEPYASEAMSMPASRTVWCAEAFLIGMLAVMPVTGTLLTRLGFVRLMRISLLGSLLSGLGIVVWGTVFMPDGQGPVLILMLLAGIFSAPLAPSAQAFAVAVHAPEQRGRAMALWGAGRFAGFLLTAMLAGPLIDTFGWSTPLAVGVVMLVPCFLLLRQPSSLPHEPSFALDLAGLCLLLLALLPLLVVLNIGSTIRSDPGYLILGAMLATTVLAGIVFLRHVGRTAEPIVSLRPLGEADFRVATIISFVVAMMTTGLFSIQMVSEVAKVSADALSWRTTAGGVAQIVGVIVGGYLVGPMIARPAACLSLIVTALGLASFNLYGENVTLMEISVTRAVMGFGMGLTVPLFAAFAYSGLDAGRTSAASSLFVFAGMMGTGMGVAALSGEFNATKALLGDALTAYRFVFWTETVGVALMVPLVWRLRADGLLSARR